MADFPADEEFDSFMEELEAQGETAVAEAERDDEKAAKQAQAQKAERADDGVVTKAEYMTDKFLASASEREKQLFAIYSHGTDTPEQVRKAIELARTNAAEEAKITESDSEERAGQIAAEQYGVGPIAPGGPVHKETPQEQFDRLRAEATARRDTRTLGRLMMGLSPDKDLE